jgi:hypothetical protein
VTSSLQSYGAAINEERRRREMGRTGNEERNQREIRNKEMKMGAANRRKKRN